MGVLGIVLLVIFIIVSILLVFMVIIQDEGSDGLGGIFAGAGTSAFGARSSSVVVKFTYVLGGLFFVLAFSLALVNKTSSGDVEALAQKKAKATTNSEWWNAPAQTQAPTGLTPASGAVPASGTGAAPTTTP
jgi:preprotein translocase subunit SecG